MRKNVRGFLYFAVTIAILVGVLRVTNWLPEVLQGGMMKSYGSIEDVKSDLGVRDIYVPSYFPQNLAWPPSRILAQSRPFLAVVMEFTQGKTGDVALVISQAADKRFAPDGTIAILQIKDQVNYTLKGRTALLEVGTCGNEIPCSRISWDEANYRISLTIKAPPFELVKIADSMLR
ncbi:MAG: hypothetical protein M1497_07575 [Nitrospirae bacterium]|nr:hypothetical protein [Nitrospirota bacterium]